MGAVLTEVLPVAPAAASGPDASDIKAKAATAAEAALCNECITTEASEPIGAELSSAGRMCISMQHQSAYRRSRRHEGLGAMLAFAQDRGAATSDRREFFLD